MTATSCQKLVVVLGPADPVLESTLTYVGLRVVQTAGEITVWAPLEWEMSWELPSGGSDLWPGFRGWEGIPEITVSGYPRVRRGDGEVEPWLK